MVTSLFPTSTRFECVIPILSVRSLSTSLDYYVEVLGFRKDWDSHTMASVSRDGCSLMLCEGEQGQPGTWVWLGVEDIEPLYAEYQKRGARIRMEPTNYAWAYEMRIEDPDGHVLRFGSEPLPDAA